MAKELERAGLPVALVSAMVSVATTVGANRITRGTAITHPLGDPARPTQEERAWRRQVLLTSLRTLLLTPEEGQVFEPGQEPPLERVGAR
jgi:glycine reductase